MIQKLRISNFQSHKDSSLDFAPGVNVIVGASDCGKTAIIRALRWLIFNKPTGDSFRSTWGGITAVEIELPERNSIEHGAHKDVTYIQRLKSDKHNQYFWNGTDNVFEAFGTGVPEPIQNILNMDETNIQMQLDSPFLISSTPGEVASFFNKIAHLDQIDDGIRNIQSSIRQTTAEIQADENRVVELTEAVKAYEYIDLVEIDLEELEKMDSDSGKLQNKSAALEVLIHDINEIDINISGVGYTARFEDEIDSILKLKEKYKKRANECGELDSLGLRLENIKTELAHLTTIIQLEPAIEHIISEKEKEADLYKDSYLFQTLIRDLTNTYTNLTESEHTLTILEQKFHDEMPDRCPLCETVITKKK